LSRFANLEKELAVADAKVTFQKEIAEEQKKAAQEIAQEQLKAAQEIAQEQLKASQEIAQEQLKASQKLAEELKKAAQTEKEKDIRIALLDEKMKAATAEILIAKQALTVRAAVESIMAMRQKDVVGGIQAKIDAAYKKDSQLQEAFAEWCNKLNCVAYSAKIPGNIYHALSANIHGGGFPLELRTADKCLAPGEWAFVIAVFESYLPRDAFCVYDGNGKLMSV
jgi:hypothetical protein